MDGFAFKKLFADLKVRVEIEGKKDPSWLMGFVQGLGKKKLTGYQVGALIDLLLVVPAPKESTASAASVEKHPDSAESPFGAAVKRP